MHFSSVLDVSVIRRFMSSTVFHLARFCSRSWPIHDVSGICTFTFTRHFHYTMLEYHLWSAERSSDPYEICCHQCSGIVSPDFCQPDVGLTKMRFLYSDGTISPTHAKCHILNSFPTDLGFQIIRTPACVSFSDLNSMRYNGALL